MRRIVLQVILVIFCLPAYGSSDPSELKILGWVENAHLVDPGLDLKAKLDTGAETSSLGARIIKKFKKDGKRWVRFAVTDRNSGEEFVLVRKRVRTIGVVQHDGSRQTRPVVMLEICVDQTRMETEVSLIDRSEFNYPLLLGRTALASFTLVDPGSVFMGEAGCGPEPAKKENKS